MAAVYLTRSSTSVQVMSEAVRTNLVVIVWPSFETVVVLVWITEPFFLSTAWSVAPIQL